MARRKSGTGSLRLRSDGRWEGRVVIGYDEKGHAIRKNVLSKSKSQCERKLKSLLSQISGEQEPAVFSEPSQEMTVGEWMDYWYRTYIKMKLRQSTQQTYENRIYKQIIPKIGDIPLRDFSHTDAQRFYGELKQGGRLIRTEIYGEGLSDWSVRSIHAHLNAAFKKAEEEKLIARNPVTDSVIPPKRGREMQVLDHEEIQRLLIQANAEGYYEMFLLDLSTGLRRGELLALQWNDINWITGEVNIQRQVQNIKGELTVSIPKTECAIRSIMLPDSILEVLKEHRKKVDSKWLFPSPVNSDTPIHPASARKKLSAILERSGCSKVRFHDLRHTFATISLEYGMDLKTLSTVLGHQSVEVTLDTYSHITEDMMENAAARIDSTIGGATAKNGRKTKKTTKKKKQVFQAVTGSRRRQGSGCISKVSANTWQGKYTPRTADGKREIHCVYAKSYEECERMLDEMIGGLKA